MIFEAKSTFQFASIVASMMEQASLQEGTAKPVGEGTRGDAKSTQGGKSTSE